MTQTVQVTYIDEPGVQIKDKEVLYLGREESKREAVQEILQVLPKDQFTKNYVVEIKYDINYGPKSNGRVYKDTTDPMAPMMVVTTNRLDIITFNKIIYNIIDPTYRVGRVVVLLDGIAHQYNVLSMLESLPMKTLLIATKIK